MKHRLPQMAMILAVGVLPGQAMAQSASAPAVRDAEVAAAIRPVEDYLSDPRKVDGLANVAGAMADAMMRLPIGGVIDAVRRANPSMDLPNVGRDATVADLAGNAPDLPARVADQTRSGARMTAVGVRGMARMAPTLIAMMRDMAAQMDRAIAEEARRR